MTLISEREIDKITVNSRDGQIHRSSHTIEKMYMHKDCFLHVFKRVQNMLMFYCNQQLQCPMLIYIYIIIHYIYCDTAIEIETYLRFFFYIKLYLIFNFLLCFHTLVYKAKKGFLLPTFRVFCGG